MCGALAALGTQAKHSIATWVARDATTAVPRAYVALLGDWTKFTVAAAPGIVGSEEDAKRAAEVVTRFANSALRTLQTPA